MDRLDRKDCSYVDKLLRSVRERVRNISYINAIPQPTKQKRRSITNYVGEEKKKIE